MFALILTGGRAPEHNYVKNYLDKADLIVAADSGMDLQDKYNCRIDYFIGDMDSLKNRLLLSRLPEDRIITYPEDKDQSDTELAIRFVKEKGYNNFILIGGGGGREDHFFALCTLFYQQKPVPRFWITQKSRISHVTASFSSHGLSGRKISCFPVGKGPWKILSKGLKWSLNDLNWYLGMNQGLSNQSLGKEINIQVLKGALILFENLDEITDKETG